MSHKQSASTSAIIGVDVSKDTLDMYALPKGEHTRINNTQEAILAFIKGKPRKTRVVLESTGPYSRLLLELLDKKGFEPCLLNAKLIYHHRLSLNQGAKTDKIDAQVIADYANSHSELRYGLNTKKQRKLLDLQRTREQLKQAITARKNQVRCSFEQLSKDILSEIVELYQDKLSKLDDTIEGLIAELSEVKTDYELLQSIKGIGPSVAKTLICALPELKQLAFRPLKRLVGIAPMANDSGKKCGKRFICGGRQEVRNALYMATIVAMRYNPVIKKYYEHKVAEGKPKKVAIVGAMAKMLKIASSVVKNQTPFFLPEPCAK